MKVMPLKIITIIISAILLGTLLFYYIETQNHDIKDTNYPSYDLLNFNSYDDFNVFLQENSVTNSNITIGGSQLPSTQDYEDQSLRNEEKSTDASEDNDYSSTNIQELGVDEPDIVKTDGSFIYIISNERVFIISAYPAEEAAIISEITFNESQTPINLFVNNDRLAIITQMYPNRLYTEYIEYDTDFTIDEKNTNNDTKDPPDIASSNGLRIDEDADEHYDIWSDTTTTQVILYDISTKEKPFKLKEIQMEGYYSNGRMVDEYIYIITVHSIYEPIYYAQSESGYIPKIKVDDVEQNIELSDIYYVDSPDTSTSFITITSFNILDETTDVTTEVFMLGYPSTIYVSSEAIYVTNVYSNYQYRFMDEIFDTYIIPSLPQEAKEEIEIVDSLTLEDYQKSTVREWIIYNYIETLEDDQKKEIAREIVRQYEKTLIHKIMIDNGDIKYTAQGSVPGSIKNQFSLSEFEGNLRVATTVNGWIMKSYISSIESYNTVYVLNETLDVIGMIENIAEGEEIYSVRFNEDICYLVTYKQVDPFYVIDFHDPVSPQVLGELKIPGYSTYLHPYDDYHVIGIGMENNTVKISLFDVLDVSNPQELASYRIDDTTDEYYWMYSTALYEHKAFLFDKEKDLLIIPVSTDYIESAYVINITLEDIQLRGIISHFPDEIESKTNSSESSEIWESSYWKEGYGYSIKRSLFIKDIIYTISDSIIQMNDMKTLDKIISINLI